MLLPKSPEPLTCTLTDKDAPPTIPDLQDSDIAKPGDPGCGSNYEACLSRKAALYYLELQNWSSEIYAKCHKPA